MRHKRARIGGRPIACVAAGVLFVGLAGSVPAQAAPVQTSAAAVPARATPVHASGGRSAGAPTPSGSFFRVVPVQSRSGEYSYAQPKAATSRAPAGSAAGPNGYREAPPAPATPSTSTWSLRSTPHPQLINGSIYNVACVTASFCIGVGAYINKTDSSSVLAEVWNGTSWAIQAVPIPSGGVSPFLNDVSCTATDACVAVGSYNSSTGQLVPLAEVWNGQTWSATTPAIPSSGQAFLDGVSCTGADACIAVGGALLPTGPTTLAESWNGTTWKMQATPQRNLSGAALYSISCTSAGACSAVGQSAFGALAERWNGKSWNLELVPNPSGSDLISVSCPAAEACMAVGYYYNSLGRELPLAVAWNGKSWSMRAGVVPPGSTATAFEGVSCAAADECTSVGLASLSGGTKTLAESWNGTSWTTEKSANRSGAATNELFGVSCNTGSSCTALGEFSGAWGVPLVLAETWNGTAWSLESAPDGKGAFPTALYGITCGSSSACTAVGAFAYGTLAQTWNGKSWTVQKTPVPAGTFVDDLLSVSCVGPNNCVAVGYSLAANGVATLAQHWNGTSWRTDSTPNPPGSSGSYLESVSCAAADACTATGYSMTSTGTSTLAETWNGASWSLQKTVNISNSLVDVLNAVSCTSSGCIAVGDYENALGTGSTLVEVSNGRTWKVVKSPSQSGAVASNLYNLSCPAANACAAVGAYGTSTGAELNFAVIWNGTTWMIHDPANVSGAPADALGGVSCTSATSCTGVGFGGNNPLAEYWNGVKWVIQTTPSPAGAPQSVFYEDACTTASVCQAVGLSFNSNFLQQSMVEVES